MILIETIITLKYYIMEGFSYSNIFETKGIEYLIIIAFFAILIPFWIVLNKRAKIVQHIQRVLGNLSFNSIKIPQGIFYSKNHTWAFLEESGVAKVGMDYLLIHLTGEVDYLNLKKPGAIINKGDMLTQIDRQGKQLQIMSPISGEIVMVNTSLLEEPVKASSDPYKYGWIYKIKPTKWVTETNNYYLAENASEWTRRELERFKDFLATSMKKHSPDLSMVALQDGGELCENTLSELPNEIWQDFQKEFLS